jgi:hypothetical protein
MKMYIPDIQEIWDEILSEKMIKKNRQYGNSVYDEDTIFSDIGDPEELIKIRLDDKMRRLKTLDHDSDKYDSELMEIVAYLMHLINWRRNSGKYGETWVKEEHKKESYTYEEVFGHPEPSSDRQSGVKKQSSKDIGEVLKLRLRRAGVW